MVVWVSLRKYSSRSWLLFEHLSALCSPLCRALRQSSMSFLSVEPQSRVVLENYSNSLLAQFDSHLGIIADRYLAFFRERSLNPSRVLYVTLTIQSSGEPSRQHSQLFSNK